MRRRFFLWTCSAALAVAGVLGLGRPAALAEELAEAANAGVAAGSVVAADAGVVADGGLVPGAVYGGGGGFLGGQPMMCLPRDYLNPHLFYNFYVGGNCGSIPAGMYPTPMPTPPLVGHTYFTYQPLLPHEFMYAHKRVYHHHYNYNRGLHRTRVIWAW